MRSAQPFKRAIFRAVVALAAMALILLSFIFGGIEGPARAALTSDAQYAYEQTEVLDDLTGATIDGEAFRLSDYPFSQAGRAQLVAFVEYCYSAYEKNRDDYALYTYVYNPAGLKIDKRSTRNKIQLSYGLAALDNQARYEKYGLTYISQSEKSGYEGLFYKFRVELTAAQRSLMLSRQAAQSRVYSVSGIELSASSTVTEYGVSKTYIYKGYAKGYGTDPSADSTLTCTVNGAEQHVSLNVRPTYWRPQGTYDDGYTRDTIHSVYFAVPNALIESYGEMTAVHATWLNALTAPILVTGNREIYNELLPLINQYVGGCSRQSYNNYVTQYRLIATKAVEEGRKDEDMAPYAGFYAYNPFFSNYDGDNAYVNTSSLFYYDHLITRLQYLFYAEGGDADHYTLAAEELIGDRANNYKGWFERYTEQYGGELINNRYSANLFEKWDSAFTDVTITSDDTYKITDNTVSWSYWDRLFGKDGIKATNSYQLSAIQAVTVNDISTIAKSTFCNKFYVAESDYEDFCTYVRSSSGSDSTVYLFRYYQSEYVSHEVTEYKTGRELALFEGAFWGKYKYIDTNAYFCQMWVQLDFDIIDLTFTKDAVDTIIPVTMSPIDIAADAAPPVSTVKDKPNKSGCSGCNGIFSSINSLIFLLITAGIVILCIIFLPPIVRLFRALLDFIVNLFTGGKKK